MDEVKECTRKLLEAIRESDVCRSYTEAREKLDESPELRKTITNSANGVMKFRTRRSRTRFLST